MRNCRGQRDVHFQVFAVFKTDLLVFTAPCNQPLQTTRSILSSSRPEARSPDSQRGSSQPLGEKIPPLPRERPAPPVRSLNHRFQVIGFIISRPNKGNFLKINQLRKAGRGSVCSGLPFFVFFFGSSLNRESSRAFPSPSCHWISCPLAPRSPSNPSLSCPPSLRSQVLCPTCNSCQI